MAAHSGNKKSKTEGNTDHGDNEFGLSIEKLKEIQDELEKVNEQASEEVLQIEQKYNEIRRPVYEKRDEIIKSIPHFWLTAFESHPVIGELLNEDDRKIFKYLDSIDVADFKDMATGYSLTFKFKPNPYFEDTNLVKTYTFQDNGTTNISGAAIKWKEGMGPAHGGHLEKIGNKRPPSEESFFSWFAETQLQNVSDGVLTDEVGDIIKEDLWPYPLKYFNMEADEEDSDGDEGDEEEDEDDEDESESEEDDDEE